MLWKWKPTRCQLFDFRAGPIGDGFDVKDLLHKMSGKTLVFIGDSLTEEQYVSLQVCSYLHWPMGVVDSCPSCDRY